MTLNLRYLICVFCLLLPWSVHSATHVLLIGISDYQSIDDLQGPINDVASLQQVLQQQWQIPTDNITILLDEAATKQAILQQMQRLITITHSSDQVIIYFSGHGTSRRDIRNRWPLPYGTGAFFPVDYNAQGTMQQKLASLLVGRTDLKPLLSQLDQKGTHTLVLMDTCFSGSAARALLPANVPLAKRFVSLNPRGNKAQPDAQPLPPPSPQSTVYPYQNIMFLSASAEWEYASDITWANLPRYPTHDDKPHGAFSDALIRVMSGEIPGDSNHDNALSYEELYRSIRQFMEQRQYPQSPQSFPSAAENSQLRNRVLLTGRAMTKQADNFLKVQLMQAAPKLSEQLQNESQIRLVQKAPDLIIQQQNNHWQITTPGGDLFAKFDAQQSEAMINRLRQEAWTRHFIYAENPQQRFNLQLNLFGDASGSTAIAGDNVGISVTSEQDAYLALFNINSQGDINILYPFTKSEYRRKLKANEPFNIAGNNKNDMIVVKAPFGVDYIVGMAFKKKPKTLLPFLGQSIPANDAKALQSIHQLISQPSADWAKTSLRLVTLAKRDRLAQFDDEQKRQQALILHDKALAADEKQIKMDLLQRAIASYPLFESRYLLGETYWQLENYQDALNQFEYALQTTHGDEQKEALTLGRIAQVKLQLYDYDGAEQHLTVARSLISDMPPWMQTLDQQLQQAFSTDLVNVQQIKTILQKKNYAVVRRIPLRIGFEFNQATLNDQGLTQAKHIAKALQALPQNQHIKLIGHTDLRGKPQYNMLLSIRRAQAVHQYLTQQLPEYQQRLCIQGKGLRHPIRRGNTETDHAINRRVEVQAVETC